MIKNWKKFNEDISSDGEIIPIGIDNMIANQIKITLVNS